jgi:hypothetical protein
LELSSKQGFVPSMITLGIVFEDGRFELNQDKTKSQDYFNAALVEISSDQLNKEIEKLKKEIKIE